MTSVTIVIPTLNEARTIELVLASIRAAPGRDILVVDGGSTDGTVEIVRRLGVPIVRQEGVGLGKAIVTAVQRSRGAIVVTLDADGAHSGTHVERVLAGIDHGYDLVLASRMAGAPDGAGMFSPRRRSTAPQSVVREVGNRLFTFVCRTLFGVPVHDVLNGCKAFRREVFESLSLEGAGQEHDVELLIKAHCAGYRVGEVAIDQGPRLGGVSKLSAFRHGFVIASVIVREAVRIRRVHKKRRAQKVRRILQRAVRARFL